MKKILYILSHIDKANEFEWLIERLDRSKFSLEIISIHQIENTALHQYCITHQIPFYHIHYQSKKDIPKVLIQTYKLIKIIKPDIVHAQLFEAGIIGITASWLARIKHRIYTRHYANYHHAYAPSGVKYDKWINSKATHIVSISQMVSEILVKKENVPMSKISLIHHGFPFENFINITEDRIQNIKQKYHLPENKKTIGVVSKYMKLKGIQFIIPAFKKIYQQDNNTHLVLANAHGDYQPEIQKLLEVLPKDSYTEILFEQDNAALFKCFDVFVHVPIDAESEAFGQIYIEALLCQIPSVFTLSGVATEIIKDKENAIVVPYQNADAIYNAVQLLLKDEAMCLQLKENGYKTAQSFSIENKISALENLYSNI